MKLGFLVVAFVILSLLFTSGCTNQSKIANPASVNCEEIGGTLEISTDAEGGQYGICKMNGKECEEWALYRGECRL